MQSGPYSVVALRQLTGLIVQAVDVDTIWDCRHTIHIDLIEEDDHEVRRQRLGGDQDLQFARLLDRHTGQHDVVLIRSLLVDDLLIVHNPVVVERVNRSAPQRHGRRLRRGIVKRYQCTWWSF